MWNIRRNQSDRICPVGIRVFIYNKLPFAFFCKFNLHKVMEMQIKVSCPYTRFPPLPTKQVPVLPVEFHKNTPFHGFFFCFRPHRHIILPESYTLILKTCGSCRFFGRNQTCRISYALPPITESNHLIFSLKRLPPYLSVLAADTTVKSLYLYCREHIDVESLIKQDGHL